MSDELPAGSPDPENTGTPKSGLPRMLPRLFFELAVVFVGVWAAFFVEAKREERGAQERAVRILEVIQFELQEDMRWSGGWLDTINIQRREWGGGRERGDLLPPFFVRIPGSERASKAAWEAALASDALSVLDPYLLREIGNLYSERVGVGARWERYMAQTEAVVLPVLPEGPAAFYDPRTGDYYARYIANMALMDEVIAEWQDKNEWSGRVVVALDEALGQMRR